MKISEYKELFLGEAQEILDTLNGVLVKLEKDPADKELLSEMFRQTHTLKSMAQSMGYEDLAGLIHSMESILSQLRETKTEVSRSTISSLFEKVDVLSQLVKAVGVDTEKEPVVERRTNLRLNEEDRRHIALQRTKGFQTYQVIVSLRPAVKAGDIQSLAILGELERFGEVVRAPYITHQLKSGTFGRHFGLFFITRSGENEVKERILAIPYVEKVSLKPLPAGEFSGVSGWTEKTGTAVFLEKTKESQRVRIPLEKLDSLMNIAGELAISKSRLEQVARGVENRPLQETVMQLSQLTSQLQESMMQARLVPLQYLFAPYPRLIRDMAVAQNKMVDLVIHGGDIGMDRTVQDEINEALLHLLKNAVAHGIEEPKERQKRKKPIRGTIKLLAKREKDFVTIELSDDGRGIDVREIGNLALQNGLITREELSSLSPREIVMLITSPGFSGAREISEAAGRGVGLNAARTKVESMGGTFDLNTKPNEGTTFFMKLPLTMAIVQAMLVGIEDRTYCIPLSHTVETIKISPGEIKSMEHREIISYRNTVLPLIRMREKLGFVRDEGSAQPPPLKERRTRIEGRGAKDEILQYSGEQGEQSSIIPRIPLVVVEVGHKKLGLVVDSLLGQQEIVIKPMIGYLKGVQYASGATILGTGKVAFIVDVGSLLQEKVKL